MGNNINLPRNIRQIGTDKGGRRVYIEDYVHSFIRDTQVDEYDDGAVGVLLGEARLDGDVSYIFVRGAVEVINAAVYTDKIAFTEETWPIVRSHISQYFAGLDIVGWYLVSSKITQDSLYVINKADADSFESADSVFFMVNPETKDEIFYEKTAGGLSPLPGYTVFYERNEKMQAYMSEYRGSLPRREEREPERQSGGEYRKLAGENGQKNNMAKSVKGHLTVIYALSMLLIIVVLVIGVNVINKHDRTGGAQGGTADREVNADPKTTTQGNVPVASVTGDITSSGGNNVTEEVTEPHTEAQTEKPTEKPTEAPTEKPTEKPTEAPTEAPTPAPTQAPYQVYTVKAGDTLLRICRDYYGRESMADAQRVLDYNGLADTSQILVGMELKIPN